MTRGCDEEITGEVCKQAETQIPMRHSGSSEEVSKAVLFRLRTIRAM